MQNNENPKTTSIIKSSKIEADNQTKVEFTLDLKRFRMNTIGVDIVALLSKQA